MPRGSAPIIPRGSAFRICLFHRQIHGSRRRAGARVRGWIFGWLWSGDYLDEIRRKRCGDHFVFGYILLEDLTGKSSSIGLRRYFYLCLGALPLLYPAAPPSVFDYCIVKYTAPAVALGRVFLMGVLVVICFIRRRLTESQFGLSEFQLRLALTGPCRRSSFRCLFSGRFPPLKFARVL